MLTLVYAKCTKEDIRSFWSDLKVISSSYGDIPQVFIGYFNVVADQSEKIRENIIDNQAVSEFNDCVTSDGFLDIGYQGTKFT